MGTVWGYRVGTMRGLCGDIVGTVRGQCGVVYHVGTVTCHPGDSVGTMRGCYGDSDETVRGQCVDGMETAGDCWEQYGESVWTV